MRSRWFHRPTLHSPQPGTEQRVSWLELFYDLVYVAAIIQLGNALSKHATPVGFLAFAALFAPIWWAWTGFTFYSNRFQVDDFLHRALVFVKMFGIAAMAVLVPGTLEGETRSFALAYVLVRAVLVAFYVRVLLQVPEGRDLSSRYAIVFGIAASVWLVSVFVPGPWVYLLWTVGLVAEMAAPATRAMRELVFRYPPDAAHMAERYGLLTIIVLGESFVKVLTDLASHPEGAGWGTVGMGGLALVVTCSLWWIYFDDVVHSRIRPLPAARFVWLYTHLPLVIGITASAVGIKKAVVLDPMLPAAGSARWLLAGSLALAYASVALLDWVTERADADMDDRARVMVRSASAATVVLIGIAGAFVPCWIFLALIATICVAQVLFDLMMAPHAEPGHDAEHLQSSFGFGAVAESSSSRSKRRRDPIEAVRRGAPAGLRRDFYFLFMEGSWWRLLASAGFLYLLLNLAFAVFYLLEVDSIEGARAGSFLDAFFFSVQTLSTIGYGALSPATPYANGLVVAEAVTGVLFVALVTGLIFAKAARPTAAVLFSDVVVISDVDGRPTLQLRLANGRGHDVVEAEVSVSAAFQETTTEGSEIRRLYDLELVRQRSPLFILTWTVMHRVDGSSPFAGLDAESDLSKLVSLIVTMRGYDSVYAQTIHARKMYYPENLRWGERFVDVLSELEDGRLAIDYRRFHDTVPEGTAAEFQRGG